VEKFKQSAYTFIIRIIIPVVIAYIGIFLYLQISSSGIVANYTSASPEDLTIWSIFYALVATLYAICVAFLLIKEMQDFAELKTSFKTEAFILKSINIYLYYFSENLTDLKQDWQIKRKNIIYSIKYNIKDYITILLDNELCSKNNKKNIDKLENKLWECIYQVGNIDTVDENDKIALQKLMEKLEDIFHIRATRSNWIDTGVSPYLMFFLIILSIAIVIPFYTFASINPLINYLSLGVLIFFLSFLLITLMDIGSPFSGYWQIPTKPYQELLENEYNLGDKQ
jgi:ABC-type multidrug transport system fused ATPase/permease subunit